MVNNFESLNIPRTKETPLEMAQRKILERSIIGNVSKNQNLNNLSRLGSEIDEKK